MIIDLVLILNRIMKMKKNVLTILGAVTLILALTLNVSYALDNYGITKNKLHVEVLAQSNSSGGESGGDSGNSSGGSSSGGLDCSYTREANPCVIKGNGSVQLGGMTVLKVKGEITLPNKEVICHARGEATCTPQECPPLTWLEGSGSYNGSGTGGGSGGNS